MTSNCSISRENGNFNILESALSYERAGMSIIPLEPRGKKPLIQWEPYQKKRAAPAEVAAWWKKWPNANIGIVCGAASGIIALDVDGPEGRKTLQEGKYQLPPTRINSTGGGGWHYIYKYPGFECRNFARKAGETLLPGVDFRGDGGYIVAPPSVHRTGQNYCWAVDDTTISEAPEWLLQLIRQQGTRGRITADEWRESITEGRRNEELTRRAGSLLAKGIPWEEALTMLQAWNQDHCKPPLPEKEVQVIVKSISNREESKPQKQDSEKPADRTAQIICLGDVEPTEVSWLWYPYLPKGKLTLLEGDPSVGKTWLALQLAATISQGWPFPELDGVPRVSGEPATVLYLSAEDGLADTLRPRLDKLGADVSRVFVLTGCVNQKGELDGITLQDIDVLEQALKRVRPALLVVDPLQGYLGAKVDMHRANEVRPVLSALSALAERFDCAALCIRHLSKSPQGRALYRGMGSIDFAAAARSILMAGQDPDNPDRRAIVHIKSSLEQAGPSIGYELKEGCFMWTGLSDMTAATLLKPERGEEEKDALTEAAEFIKDILSNGPLPAKVVKNEAKAAGISSIALRRAKDPNGLVSVRVFKEKTKDGQWLWELENSLRENNEHLQNIERPPINKGFLPPVEGNHMSIFTDTPKPQQIQEFPDLGEDAHQDTLRDFQEDDQLLEVEI